MAKALKMSASSAPTPAPSDHDTDDSADASASADGGSADTGGDSDSGEDQSGQVLLTVLKTGDGEYRLVQGDEDDGDGQGSDDETFDSVGALLKGILEIVQEDASSEGAEGSAQDQFSQGFGADQSPTPAGSAGLAQKY